MTQPSDAAPDGPGASPLSRRQVDEQWMRAALDEARAAMARDEVPVGAVLVCDGRELVRTSNRMVADGDPLAHAELLALRHGTERLGARGLRECTLYVTLEPCAMCAGAIVLARVGRVVFGAWDDKAGMAGSVGDLLRHPRLNHRPQVLGGVMADTCGALLSYFFAVRRAAPRPLTSTC
ncbi:MAG TPA: tRNA adenosine(34) deaminase TadA [Gemmatimonadaceae bacterium]|nr:tRNA adenosine(34) deaminase TadA [Gemmatimonadaceae bacterium]